MDLLGSGFLGNKLKGGYLVQQMYWGDSHGQQLGESEGSGTGRGRRCAVVQLRPVGRSGTGMAGPSEWLQSGSRLRREDRLYIPMNQSLETDCHPGGL